MIFSFFFFNDTATTEIYTLSLHDALPISRFVPARRQPSDDCDRDAAHHRLFAHVRARDLRRARSEEHTSELQSLAYLVCRLLLEKKKKHYKMKDTQNTHIIIPSIMYHTSF